MEKRYVKENFDQDLFWETLPSNLKAKIVGLKREANILIVYINSVFTSAEDIELATFVSDHDPAGPIPASLQKKKDFIRYEKRAAVKDQIMAELAADNMERVRDGIWTVPQLISLTQDAELKNLLDDISTLSFEIAYSKVDTLSNPILTQDIKDAWKAKLASHFYL